MLNARQAQSENIALTNTYRKNQGGTPAEQAASKKVHRAEQERITNEFRSYLDNQYAPNLPKDAHDLLWSAAFQHGGMFEDLEDSYSGFASFANAIIATVKI